VMLMGEGEGRHSVCNPYVALGRALLTAYRFQGVGRCVLSPDIAGDF